MSMRLAERTSGLIVLPDRVRNLRNFDLPPAPAKPENENSRLVVNESPSGRLVVNESPSGRLVVNLGVTRSLPARTRTTPGGKVVHLADAVVGGEDVLFDLVDGPHVLISGMSSSGKSIALHNILSQLLASQDARSLGLVLIDPKMVELARYSGDARLVGPDGPGQSYKTPQGGARALAWVLRLTLLRFALMEACRVTCISGVPAEAMREASQPVRIVVVIDELADLVSTDGPGRPVASSLARTLALGRAAGLHVLASTQSPRSDILPGPVRANIPSRLAFAVRSATESRIALDMRGAEELEGCGDGLWLPSGARMPVRMQGALGA